MPGINPGDYEGILAEYAGNEGHPWYSSWRMDLDADRLTGTSEWFFENYVAQKEALGLTPPGFSGPSVLGGGGNGGGASVVAGSGGVVSGGVVTRARPPRTGLLILAAVAVWFFFFRR